MIEQSARGKNQGLFEHLGPRVFDELFEEISVEIADANGLGYAGGECLLHLEPALDGVLGSVARVVQEGEVRGGHLKQLVVLLHVLCDCAVVLRMA